jgi:hypothetical protein
MNKQELLQLVGEIEDDGSVDEVLSQTELAKTLLSNGTTLDAFKEKITNDADFKAFMDSEKDKHANKSLDSWKANNLQKLVDAEILKRNPSKSPQELEIENLKKQFEEEKQLRELSEQKSKLKDELKDKNVDPRIIDLLINKDADVTRANVALYLDANKNYVQKEVEKRIKEGQYTPPNSDAEKDKKSKLEKDMRKAFGY